MTEPKEVRRLVAELRAAGFDPAVRGAPGGAWEVAVEGKRIRVTAGYVFRNGRTRRVPGTCTVDGKPHALVDLEALHALWAEYEEAPVAPAPAVLMEVCEPGDRPVPHAVQFAVDNLVHAGKGEFEVRIGMSGEHWVAAIDLPGSDGLRLVFTRYRRIWDLDRDQPVQVIVGGQDRSAEAGGDVEKAMALVLEGSVPPPPDAPPPGTSAVGRRESSRPTTGVATRRMVVIRE